MESKFPLRSILDGIQPKLEAVSTAQAHEPIAVGKWSKIQILGHLIDSGINNLNRFIRAQLTEDMIFEPYAQEFWVKAQAYEKQDWDDVVALFLALNNQISVLIQNISEDKLTKTRTDHSMSPPFYFDKAADSPVTLEVLIWDYIGHLEHHIRQVFPDYHPVVLNH
ncbi:MAG: DinB family protein [Cyclobacteriaceae bacterium]